MKFLERVKYLTLNLFSPSTFKLKAFTLAEVLITLAIIGVVASMTIPSLISTTQDLQYKSAYKKAYSMLCQALNKAAADGSLVDVSGTRTGNNDGGNNLNFIAIMNEFNATVKCVHFNNGNCWESSGEKFGHQYSGSEGRPAGATSDLNAFVDNSGMAWTALEWAEGRIAVDTNGNKGPNQYGKDRFAFHLYSDPSQNLNLSQNGSEDYGVPIKVSPYSDNNSYICTGNKCATKQNYYGVTWLFK